MPLIGRLPIIRLGPPLLTVQQVQTVIAPALGLGAANLHYPISGDVSVLVMEDGPLRLDADLRLGRLWFANRDVLWNPRKVPNQLNLHDSASSAALASQWLLTLGLMPPTLNDPVSALTVGPELQWVDSTRSAYWLVRECRRDPLAITYLDTHACLALTVNTNDPETGVPARIPVLGFGGKAGVTFGEKDGAGNDVPIGVSCSWRRALFIEDWLDVTEKPGPFLAPAKLGYRLGEGKDGDLTLYPVWTYDDNTQIDGGRRKTAAANAVSVNLPPWQPQPGAPAPSAPRLHGTVVASAGNDAGVAWIDDPKLPLNETNARRFEAALRAASWGVPFVASGTHGALVQWVGANPAVDAVDLLFYTGHADETGWTVPDGKVNYANNVAYGGNDLDWLAISACGPLQDAVVTEGTEDVFNWNRVFGGLRMLLGFATQVADSADDGTFFVSHAQLGLTVAEAWFRMARDVQSRYGPETDFSQEASVFAAVLYPEYPAGAGESEPRRDHLCGFGPVTPKPQGDPEYFVAVFVPA
jgi:hypothetical protein